MGDGADGEHEWRRVCCGRDDKIAGAADSARYDPERQRHPPGGRRSLRRLRARRSTATPPSLAYESGRIRFEGAEFSLGSGDSRGAAAAIRWRSTRTDG